MLTLFPQNQNRYTIMSPFGWQGNGLLGGLRTGLLFGLENVRNSISSMIMGALSFSLINMITNNSSGNKFRQNNSIFMNTTGWRGMNNNSFLNNNLNIGNQFSDINMANLYLQNNYNQQNMGLYNNNIMNLSTIPQTDTFTSTIKTNTQTQERTVAENNKTTDSTNKTTVDNSKAKVKFSKEDICKGTFKGDKVSFRGVTHYKYSDCDSSRLVSVGNGQKLRNDAAKAFNEMKAAASKAGVDLFVASGYRSTEKQITTFKKKFSNTNNPSDEAFAKRLKVSAPSGYSEHHTGLAVDINSTETSFANTKAYQWLTQHAKEFGFEISFPKGNKQGLDFEPWHWRYVGKNNENANVFAAARS